MIIFPAVDIKEGRCVRLLQGRAQDATIYGDPVEMARKWQNSGAKYLHVVDLDAAFSGNGVNLATIRNITNQIGIPVQMGGGIRSLKDIEERLQIGVSRVILGTVAVKEPTLVEIAVKLYPGRIAVGIDVKDGQVAIKGWVEKSKDTPLEFAKRMADFGVDTIIYTDISRDGMLCGVNVEATKAVSDIGLNVIASGGVGTLDHLKEIKNAGLYGAIVGKALYDGTVEIKDALALQ